MYDENSASVILSTSRCLSRFAYHPPLHVSTMLSKCPEIRLYSFRIFSISIYLLDPFLIDDERPVWVAANVGRKKGKRKICRTLSPSPFFPSPFLLAPYRLAYWMISFPFRIKQTQQQCVRINDKWCFGILLWHAFWSRLIFEIVCLLHPNWFRGAAAYSSLRNDAHRYAISHECRINSWKMQLRPAHSNNTIL